MPAKLLFVLFVLFALTMCALTFRREHDFIADCMAAERSPVQCSAKYSVASALTFWRWNLRYEEGR